MYLIPETSDHRDPEVGVGKCHTLTRLFLLVFSDNQECNYCICNMLLFVLRSRARATSELEGACSILDKDTKVQLKWPLTSAVIRSTRNHQGSVLTLHIVSLHFRIGCKTWRTS